MIFRAICYSTHERLSREPEAVVFVQAGTRDAAASKLRTVLSTLWEVEPETVEFYNLNDEAELLAQSIGGEKTGDARFFEIGAEGGRPRYLDYDVPVFLLRPKAYRRMMKAWQRLNEPNLALLFQASGKPFLPNEACHPSRLNPVWAIGQFTDGTLQLLQHIADYRLDDDADYKAKAIARKVAAGGEPTIPDLVEAWRQEATLIPFAEAVAKTMLPH
jgi:hypothetical protein